MGRGSAPAAGEGLDTIHEGSDPAMVHSHSAGMAPSGSGRGRQARQEEGMHTTSSGSAGQFRVGKPPPPTKRPQKNLEVITSVGGRERTHDDVFKGTNAELKEKLLKRHQSRGVSPTSSPRGSSAGMEGDDPASQGFKERLAAAKAREGHRKTDDGHHAFQGGIMFSSKDRRPSPRPKAGQPSGHIYGPAVVSYKQEHEDGEDQ
eukprot:SRR837773.11460.p1 GENE.SRR837773.11460~~SRR837773.11460.p1  ORF type:complete len:228 (-),score=28.89 SRR837773.11460:65-676(-)